MRYVLFVAAILLLIFISTGDIGLLAYNDGGRVVRILFFGAEITLVDEPRDKRLR